MVRRMTHNDYANFIRSLACEFVTHQKDLEVDAEPKKDGVRVLIRGNKEDAGKLIGSGGATAKAMTTLVDIAAKNNNGWAGKVLVMEPTHGKEFKRTAFVPNPKWKRHDDMSRLLMEAVVFIFPGIHASVTIHHAKDPAMPHTGLAIATKSPSKLPIIVESALNTIFHAIGNQQGHRLSISVDQWD